ncbi:MAG: PrgI family mobile element protein [Candidatus Dormibacteria bacterium]
MPTRWGMFTGHQLAWLAAALLPLYLLLRAHLPLQEALPLCLPWLVTATAMAFGRCKGRALDAFAGDWALFQVQPKTLTHPESRSGPALFIPIDSLDRGALPWCPP